MPGLRRRYFAELFRRVGKFLALFAAVYVASAVLFFLLEAGRVPLFASFYWAIVTLSTAGYGDIVPTNDPARLVAMATLFVQIFLLGYLISVITTAVTGEQQKRALGLLGTDLAGHIVVLGYSPVGQAAVRELLAQEQKVAVVTERAEEVANVRALASEAILYVTYGPPGERDLLLRANVPAAHAVIVSTLDDATNMIAALNVRALAPRARVVVSVARPELRDTLKAAGVTYVATPSVLGGRLCASAAFEPEVADALEDLSQGDVRSDFQEYALGATTPLARLAFGEAEALVRRSTGCILVGYGRPGPAGEFATVLGPEPGVRLEPGDVVLVVGSLESVRRFRAWFGAEQGR